MRVLVFGDIYGRIGRNAFIKNYSTIRSKYNPDFVIVNPENITSGRGPIEKHIKELDLLGGIDLYTTGNHIFDNEEAILDYLSKKDSKMIRPANYYESDYYNIPGKGYKIIEKNGKKLLVINLISGTFLRDEVYNPFLKISEILKGFENEKFNGILIDFHRETTSEIYAMGMFLDGKISFVFGTHTHIQTNDDLILPGGTGLISDVGMSGGLYSVVGASFESMKPRFLSGINKGKIDQDLGKDYVVSYLVIDIDENTGKCVGVEKQRIIGKL